MGRLKKDHSGYKTSGLWAKYKYPQVNEGIRQPKPSKDTRRWCKGKVGLKHSYELVERHKGHWYSFSLYRCASCGKKQCN